jgi:hypothetical protein
MTAIEEESGGTRDDWLGGVRSLHRREHDGTLANDLESDLILDGDQRQPTGGRGTAGREIPVQPARGHRVNGSPAGRRTRSVTPTLTRRPLTRAGSYEEDGSTAGSLDVSASGDLFDSFVEDPPSALILVGEH